MSKEISIQIALAAEDLQAAQELARAAKLNLQVQPKSQFIDPLSIILIAGGAVAVVKFTADLIDRFHGGIIVDVRPSAKELIKRDKSVPYGWALVIAADGKVEINVHDAPKDAMERWVSEIVEGVLKNVKDVGESAAKAFGKGNVNPATAT